MGRHRVLLGVDSGHLGRIVSETHTRHRRFLCPQSVKLCQGALPAVVSMKSGPVIRNRLFKLHDVHPSLFFLKNNVIIPVFLYVSDFFLYPRGAYY